MITLIVLKIVLLTLLMTGVLLLVSPLFRRSRPQEEKVSI